MRWIMLSVIALGGALAMGAVVARAVALALFAGSPPSTASQASEVLPAVGTAAIATEPVFTSPRPLVPQGRTRAGAMTEDRAPAASGVDDLARKMAPALEKEALDDSAHRPPQAAEVERELLDTWKEQQQILAGKRVTADSVIEGAR